MLWNERLEAMIKKNDVFIRVFITFILLDIFSIMWYYIARVRGMSYRETMNSLNDRLKNKSVLRKFAQLDLFGAVSLLYGIKSGVYAPSIGSFSSILENSFKNCFNPFIFIASSLALSDIKYCL